MTELILRNICKEYQKGQPVVNDVSFKVEPGEFMVLVGPSGCGKSTILRMIAGLETVDSGELLFNGKVMNEIQPAKRNIGMVFQNYALYPHLSVFENLAFPLKVLKQNKIEIQKRVNEISELIDLKDFLDRKPKQLSGGQRQRVALGRALIRKPDVFLFDEPLSNLDAKLRVQMRTEIINLHRNVNTTSIYVTHDQTEAMTMGSRLVVLNDGLVMQIDTPANLYSKPENKFVAGFLGSPQINFFEGVLFQDNGLKFIENDSQIIFNLDLEINYSEHEKVTLGIRPENMIIDSNEIKNENGIQVQITNIEFLGHETIIYFKTSGSLKCIRTDTKIDFNIGDIVSIYPEPGFIHVFDGNGLRIK